MTEFWMVWNHGGGSCRRKHATFEIALAEAERLNSQSPTHTFVVLKAVCYRDKEKWRDCRPASIDTRKAAK